MELREQYVAYLRKSLDVGREPYPSILEMLTRLAKEKPPTIQERELIKEIVVLEQQLGLEIHQQFIDSANQLKPPPAPQPAVAETTSPDQPVTSLPPAPQQPLPGSAATPSAQIPDKDPVQLRQQYKSYLEKCTQQGREPQGAILDLIAQLAKEKPPSAMEEADIKEIVQMEQQFGLTIHSPAAQADTLEVPPPEPQQVAPISSSPPQTLGSPAVEATDEPLMMGTAADIVAGMSNAPAAVPAPQPAPAPAPVAQAAPAPAAPEQDPVALRQQYKEYLSKCISQGQQPEAGILDMITQLVIEKPPTSAEQATINEIAQMEQQVGLAIHTGMASAPQPAVQPAPPAPPPFVAATQIPAPAVSAGTASDSAAVARDALERLVQASDLASLSEADGEALLASLVRALAAVQSEVIGDAPSLPTPAPTPAPAPVEDPLAAFYPERRAAAPSAPLPAPAAPMPAPASVAFGAPAAATDHESKPYYVSGMERMDLAQYKRALEMKKQAISAQIQQR